MFFFWLFLAKIWQSDITYCRSADCLFFKTFLTLAVSVSITSERSLSNSQSNAFQGAFCRCRSVFVCRRHDIRYSSREVVERQQSVPRPLARPACRDRCGGRRIAKEKKRYRDGIVTVDQAKCNINGIKINFTIEMSQDKSMSREIVRNDRLISSNEKSHSGEE